MFCGALAALSILQGGAIRHSSNRCVATGEVISSLTTNIGRGKEEHALSWTAAAVEKSAVKLDKREYETIIGLYCEFLDELVRIFFK